MPDRKRDIGLKISLLLICLMVAGFWIFSQSFTGDGWSRQQQTEADVGNVKVVQSLSGSVPAIDGQIPENTETALFALG